MMLQQQQQQRSSSTNTKSRRPHDVLPGKIPHDFVFTRWMGSWERRLSLWSDQTYSDALLAYIGKIYGQQANVYHYFNRLWNESMYNASDELDLLHILIERLSKIPGAKGSLAKRQGTSRVDGRFNELKSIVDQNVHGRFRITSSLAHNDIIRKESINSYFDLGCGNGLITCRIGTHFDLSPENIFGGDVFNSKNPELTFVSIDSDQALIDLADQRVDLITCLVTLHHVPNLDGMLKELARIIRPSGYLIIREHDCRLERSLGTKYLNFIHAIMMIARIGEFSYEFVGKPVEFVPWSEEKKKIIQYTKSIEYKTREEWQRKFQSAGFDLVATYDYDSSRTGNPQRLFYAMYKRNGKNND